MLDQKRTRRIFEKLLRVAPELRLTGEFAKSSVPGFMDLNLDILLSTEGYRRISLSHYWKHGSGDMIADPDMVIAVFFHDGLAEALTYQDYYVYEETYPLDGEPPDLAVHNRLNRFLEQWLDNLAEQGHVLPRGG